MKNTKLTTEDCNKMLDEMLNERKAQYHPLRLIEAVNDLEDICEYLRNFIHYYVQTKFTDNE